MKYFYLVWALGWLLGLLTLSGRVRMLVTTGVTSFLLLFGYTLLYLLLNVPWLAPLPVYLAHGLVPLFVISAVAGYWGGLRVAAQSAHEIVAIVIQRAGDAWSRLGAAKRARLPVPRSFHGDGAPAQSRLRFLTAVAAFIAVGIIPAAVADFAVRQGPVIAESFHEHWPDEPELTRFFEDKIGLEVGRPFRGSVHFWPYNYAIGLTVKGLWARGIPTVMQYGQLVTPPSFYFATAFAKRPGGSNGFVLIPGQSQSWESYRKALQLLGARYYVVAPQGFPPSAHPNVPVSTFPHRPLSGEHGLWYVYEIPHPNIGDYSPTEVMTAQSGAEIAAMMAEPNFDFTRQVVLSAQVSQPLVPARDMRLSLIRGGLHVSGHSDGSSLVALPLQFSHCLRAARPAGAPRARQSDDDGHDFLEGCRYRHPVRLRDIQPPMSLGRSYRHEETRSADQCAHAARDGRPAATRLEERIGNAHSRGKRRQVTETRAAVKRGRRRYASLSHFCIKLFLAAPASALPSLLTALLSQVSCADA